MSNAVIILYASISFGDELLKCNIRKQQATIKPYRELLLNTKKYSLIPYLTALPVIPISKNKEIKPQRVEIKIKSFDNGARYCIILFFLSYSATCL